MTNETVQAPIATGVGVTVSGDGNYVGLSFEAQSGEPIVVGFPAQNLGNMIAEMINTGENIASQHKTKIEQQESVTALPIGVVSLRVAVGRTETEALLSIRTGPMTLTFAVDLTTLHGTCENLFALTKKTSGPKKVN